MITSIALIAAAVALLLWPSKSSAPSIPTVLRPALTPVAPPKPAISHIDALMALSKVRDRLAVTGGVEADDEKLLQSAALALLKRSEK